MTKHLKTIPLLCALTIITSCAKNNFTENQIESTRSIASNNSYHDELKSSAMEKGHTLEFPSGVNSSEQKRMWHLSEGSDIYPTLWLMNLKSFLSSEKGSLFFQNLDKKFGVIKSPYGNSQISPYAWVGVTAVWDGDELTEQDLIRESITDFSNLPKVKKLRSGKPAVAMTGANCAFCHTGSISDNSMNNPIIIDGAPATIEMKGFFYDIIGSTYQMMFTEKELVEFYERMKVIDGANKASRFVIDLKKEMNVKDTLLTEAITLLIKTPIIGAKVNKALTNKAGILLYEKKHILTKYLVRMLKETYDLDSVTPLMEKRMEYLTWFGAPNPDVVTTPEGYGRTDAFGRISNATIRMRSYTHLTAPVSLPPMYAMKYKAFYHYNANTNSLVSRNIGQAFGLGAIVTGTLEGDNKKLLSTVNLPNLVELEKLIHKVPVPEYTKIFPNRGIQKDLIVKGCEVYLAKCIQCHEADESRVGPQQKLINHKLIDIDVIDTDRQYIKNISKDALGMPFKKAIFGFTDAIKDGYYSENYISKSAQKEFAQELVRGPEIFRDTFLGEDRFPDNSVLNYANIKKNTAFTARHLAGVWSTAPYLHNGSVPNIQELLLPKSKRSAKFIVGNLGYDHAKLGFVSELDKHPHLEAKLKWKSGANPCYDHDDPYCFNTNLVGNDNVGHSPAMYGGELRNQEKIALIEFLKVLTPELETSWKSTPVYKIENNKCFLR